MKRIGWGVIGPGSIAHRFLHDLTRCEGAGLAAVASRSSEKAAAFATQYGFEHSYGEYESLLKDPAVDIVYVATPHPYHHRHAIQAMEAGKAVLCEKPLAVNTGEAAEMIGCARRNGVFFMEAMWTRCFPVNKLVHERISSGRYGQVTLIEADFGFGSWNGGRVVNPDSRLFSPKMAGGSLLDVGVYCVSYASWVKGAKPIEVKALANIVDTGVDGMTAALLKYGDGALAVLRSAVVQNTRQTAVIYCEKATIEVPDFWHPSRAVIRRNDGSVEELDMPYGQDGSTGFQFEAEEAMRCIGAGLVESPLMPWRDSLAVMETLDEIRGCIGLKYPFED